MIVMLYEEGTRETQIRRQKKSERNVFSLSA